MQLRLFGAPQLLVGDRPAALSSAKALALLAYLALAAGPQPRERLIGLLWAESSGEAARKNLRNALWSIRRALGEAVVQTGGDRLELDPQLWVDVREFERLAAAWPVAPVERPRWARALAELHRGPLLDGLQINEAPEFELWLTGERERLHQRHLQQLQRLVLAYQAEGDWPALIEAARLALAHDPLQEPVYQALIAAHARQGDRAEALRQYDLLRGALDRELGVAPLVETDALRAAVVGGAIGPEAPRRTERPPEPAPLPFVGRVAERALLDAALADARAGRARVALISGDLGIGKTRLWAAWAAGLPPETALLCAGCVDVLDALPLVPVAELLRGSPALRGLLRPGSPLAPVWLAEIARLLPELRADWPDLPPPAALAPAEQRRALFEALAQCLRALSAPALVVCIDDLHWSDRATLDWLAYLLHRLRDAPLLLVCTYRSGEAGDVLTALAAQWGREGLLQRIPLGPLSGEEAAGLLAALGGRPETQALAAGNPYFLIELARSAPGDIPQALSDLIRARLARLPEPARQTLQAALVLQPLIEPAALRQTSGRGEEETLDALDTLLRAAVLEERGNRFVFSHPLIASVVREDLSVARRAFLHRRAAEALETLHAGRLAEVAGQLAAHYGEAGDRGRAARYAQAAGDHALAVAAPREAVRLYEQALAYEPTPARRKALGSALDRAGERARARAAFQTAMEEAAAAGDRQTEAGASLGLAYLGIAGGQAEEAQQYARRALALLPPDAPVEIRALGAFLLGAALMHGGAPHAEAAAQLATAARLATDHDLTAIAARSQFELANDYVRHGDLAAARRAIDEAIRLAQAARDFYQEALGRNNAAHFAVLAGDLPVAARQLDAARTLAETWGLDALHQWLASTSGELALAEGRLDAAEDWFRRGAALAEAAHNRAGQASYCANQGLLARARGDLPGAARLLAQARAAVPEGGTLHLQAQIGLWLAEVHQARGDRAAAAAALALIPPHSYSGLRRREQALLAQLAEE